MTRDIRGREDRPGLYCIELRTENWETLVQWYREALGLRVLVRVLDDGYALLEAGETRLALLRRAKSGDASARISLAFEVTDVGISCSRLQAAGWPAPTAKPSAEGLREASLTDPDGNMIRLFSWPKNR